MIVLNETADLYRYFDATSEAEYLFDCIEDTIGRDLKTELDFLRFFDAAAKSVMEIRRHAESTRCPASAAYSPE